MFGRFHERWSGVGNVCSGEKKKKHTLVRTMAEISWAEKVLVSPRYSTEILGLPLSSTILKGQDSISFLTVASSKRRPMRRLERKDFSQKLTLGVFFFS